MIDPRNKKLYQDFIITSLIYVVQFLMGFISAIILTSKFNLENYAKYSLVLVFYSFFFTIINFGFSASIVKNIAQSSSKSEDKIRIYVANGFIWKLVQSSVLSVLLYALGDFLEEFYKIPGFSIIIKYCSIFLFFSSVDFYFECVFQGLKKFSWYAFSNIVFNVMKFFIVLFFQIPDISLLILNFALLSTVQLIIIIAFLQRRISFLKFLNIDRVVTQEIFSLALPAFTIAFLTLIISKFNQFILAYFVSPSDISFYTIAMTLFEAFNISYYIFLTASFPIIVSNMVLPVAERNTKNHIVYNEILRIGLFISISITFISLLFNKNIVTLFFTETYLPAVNMIDFLVFLINLKILAVIGQNFLFAENRTKIFVKINLISAGINIILSFLLIPLFYVNGAIISIICSESCSYISQYISAKKIYHLKIEKSYLRDIVKLILVNILVFMIILFVMTMFQTSFFISLLFYISIYAIFVVVFKVIKFGEIRSIFRMFFVQK